MIDNAIVSGTAVGVFFLGDAVSEVPGATRLLLLLIVALVLLYEPILVSRRGATIGHAMSRIQVVDARTGRWPSFGRALARFVIKMVVGIPSFITMALSRRHQSVHDLLTQTIVQVPATEDAVEFHEERYRRAGCAAAVAAPPRGDDPRVPGGGLRRVRRLDYARPRCGLHSAGAVLGRRTNADSGNRAGLARFVGGRDHRRLAGIADRSASDQASRCRSARCLMWVGEHALLTIVQSSHTSSPSALTTSPCRACYSTASLFAALMVSPLSAQSATRATNAQSWRPRLPTRSPLRSSFETEEAPGGYLAIKSTSPHNTSRPPGRRTDVPVGEATMAVQPQTRLWIDAQTLAPMENHRHNGLQDGVTTFERSAAHTRYTPRGKTEQRADTSVSGPLFASGELEELIRAAPLAPGYGAAYTLYYGPPRQLARPATFKVVGSEIVAGRDGTSVDCWVVDAPLSEGLNTFFVSKVDHLASFAW